MAASCVYKIDVIWVVDVEVFECNPASIVRDALCAVDIDKQNIKGVVELSFKKMRLVLLSQIGFVLPRIKLTPVSND